METQEVRGVVGAGQVPRDEFGGAQADNLLLGAFEFAGVTDVEPVPQALRSRPAVEVGHCGRLRSSERL
jgi:hypothetical protein